MKASVLDLRRRMKEVLKALDRNEAVTILYRGRRKGVLYPAGSSHGRKCSVQKHAAFGMWKNRRDLRHVEAAVRRMRKGRGHAV